MSKNIIWNAVRMSRLLEKAYHDEEEAIKAYSKLIASARKLGYLTLASKLTEILKDEKCHKKELYDMGTGGVYKWK